MRILVCGATGFVGSAIFKRLQQEKHECLRGVRNPQSSGDVEVNYLQALDPEYWKERLDGIDVVINAVGVLRNSAKTPMMVLHEDAPIALFKACEKSGVKRIVNISALGVESGQTTKYFQTKQVAEQALFSLVEKTAWLNMRPSLIYGKKGASARILRFLAALPVHFLPKGGMQEMQPVHIDDLTEAIANWIEQQDVQSVSMDVVGREVVTLREMLDSYRAQLNKSKAFHIHIPGIFMQLVSIMGEYIPSSLLSLETLAMLESGNTGKLKDFERLLGRAPRSVDSFIVEAQIE